MIYVLYSVVTVRHLRMHPGLANPDDPVLGTLPLVSRPGEGMGDGYAPLLYISYIQNIRFSPAPIPAHLIPSPRIGVAQGARRQWDLSYLVRLFI